MLFTIIIFIEAICLGFAVWSLRKEDQWWKYFIHFLLLTVLVETAGYILYFRYGMSNHWLFNLRLLPEIAFLFFVLYRLNSNFFRVALWLGIAFALFLMIYGWESFRSGWKSYSANANTLASITIIITACLFYYYLLKQDTFVEITSYAPFWIVSGLLIFYLGAFGCNLFVKQLTDIYKRTGVPIRFIIMLVLNFILYACWAYAFLCRYRHKISSSSS